MTLKKSYQSFYQIRSRLITRSESVFVHAIIPSDSGSVILTSMIKSIAEASDYATQLATHTFFESAGAQSTLPESV